MNMQFEQEPARVVVFTGNLHRPSRSRALGAHLAARVAEALPAEVRQYDVVDAGRGLGAAFSREELTPEALEVVEAVESADGLIAITPVYKGSFTGLFKHLFDFVGPLALVDKPVLIGATGGGHRHALAVEHQLRPLFGFFSALTAPTAVYAADSEFADDHPADPALLERAELAVHQFAGLLAHQQAVRHTLALTQARNSSGP
jgi:FMN reductase